VDILKGLSASEVDADSSTQEPITRSASDSHVADLGPNSDTVVRDKEAMLVGASAMKSFAEQNADPSEELTVIEFENASPDDLTGFAPSAVALDAVAPGGEQPTSEEQWPTDLSESPSLRGTSSETAEISSQTQVGVQNTETTAVVESVETTTVDEDRPTPKNASDRLAERLRNLASASGQSAPARPRSEPTTRPAEEFKTIEIESLKSQLNAAGLGRAAPDSNIEVLEPQTEVGSTSENQKRLTERLSKLSESIAAYCEPVKKESPQ
jgi:hypothetical protein